MAKYVVSWTIPQWYQQWITVEADSKEEAVAKVKAQSPISEAEGSEFLHVGDQQDFEFDETRTKRLRDLEERHTPERNQIAQDLLVAALEGGSDYWIEKHKFVTTEEDPSYARVLKYNEGLDAWRDGQAILIVSELDSGEHYRVLPYDVLASAERAALERAMNLNEFHDHHDAGDADEVLQYACFSEIIYG